MVYKYYKIDGDKITLLKRKCLRCNSLMADHYDRYACGKCGYTAFKTKEEKTKAKTKAKKAKKE
ncbi:MAG: 30S ribosomal protein S27ae [Candidatus Lokiarchaeota archaeon]|nr:30S ribosomal protein S27ae [Candidatus Lokiarchaeota archaeon]